MKKASEALIYVAVISAISDACAGSPVSYHEIEDALEVIGLDSKEIINLPPVKAVHEVCKKFAAFQLDEQTLKEIYEGEA